MLLTHAININIYVFLLEIEKVVCLFAIFFDICNPFLLLLKI